MKLNSDQTKRQKGFSLIEVMIAIAILSFIVMAIVSVTGSSQDTAINVVREDREVLQVETALARLEWDISQIFSPLYFSHAMEPTGLTESAGAVYNQLVERYSINKRFSFPSYEALPVPTYELQEKNTFTFFTTSNRRKFKNTKQSHFAWVRYELADPSSIQNLRQDSEADNGEEEVGNVLVRKFLPENVFSADEIQWDDVKSQVLLRRIEKLVFEFWNPQTRKWTDNLSTIKQGVNIIRGVKLTLEWIDPDGIKRTFIRVFRPLFPSFEPENMYKLIQQANGAGARGSGSSSDSSQSSSSSSGSQGEEEE